MKYKVNENEPITLVFNGSPKSGTSKSICDMIDAKYQNVVIVNAYEVNVKPCIACDYCFKNPCKCVFSDMDEIYDLIAKAEVIIAVSPIHVGSISAPLLAIFTRLQIYYTNKFLLGSEFPFLRKKGYAIAVSGTDWGMQEQAALTIYKHSFYEMNCDLLQYLYLTNSDQCDDYSMQLSKLFKELDNHVKRK